MSQRWGVGIQQVMAQQNKRVEDLSQFVDLPLTQLKDWIEDRQGIPDKYQTLIASYLQTPARKLFTDIPPGTKSSV